MAWCTQGAKVQKVSGCICGCHDPAIQYRAVCGAPNACGERVIDFAPTCSWLSLLLLLRRGLVVNFAAHGVDDRVLKLLR